MDLDTHTAAGRVKIDGRFVGRLELVERVADECGAVACTYVDSVFHGHARKCEVGRVAEQALGRAHHAFDPIGQVRERVLNRAATRAVVAIVGLRVSRSKPMKRLPRGHCGFEHWAEFALPDEVAGLGEEWEGMINVGDGRAATASRCGIHECIHVLQ